MSFMNMYKIKKSFYDLFAFICLTTVIASSAWSADNFTNYGHRHWNQPPEPTTGLRILNLNVQNFFNGDYKNGKVDFSQSRGPQDLPAYEDKKAALVHLIEAVNADIIVLEEVENDIKSQKPAIVDFTTSLKAITGIAFKPVEFNARFNQPYGSDKITQFILYHDKKGLSLDGKAKSIKPANGGRPSIVQAFSYQISDDDVVRFSLVATHLKSKLNTCGVDQACEKNRTQQAVSFSKALKEYESKGAVIWVGDFNSEPYQPAMQALSQAGWSSLLDMAQYSYVYEDQKILLDHVLMKAQDKLGPKVNITAQVWNINNPPEGQLNNATPVSDHDPIIIDVNLRE